MKVQPIYESFAADIEGVDVAQLSEEDFESIYDAWL